MKSNDISEKKKALIEKIEIIRDTEVKKPYSQIDAPLVAECVDFVAEMKFGFSKLSDDEIKNHVNVIPFAQNRNRPHGKNFTPMLIAAACVAALLVSMMVYGTTVKYDPLLSDKSFAEFAKSLVPGQSGFFKGEKYYSVPKDSSRQYKSTEQLLRKEKNLDGVLFPSYIPEQVKLSHIDVSLPYEGDCPITKEKICYVLEIDPYNYQPGDISFSFTITLGGDASDVIQSEYYTRSDEFEGLECYVWETESMIQGYILNNGNLYNFQFDTQYLSRDDFVKTIESLKK
ncbi:MAG: hypothetical protein GX051_04765 [Clostridiales bacterium]|nr:hypothetical protein [Clostridiales bacterium]